MVARNCWMGKATCCTMCYKLTPAEKQRCSGQIGQGSAWLLGTSAFQSAIKQSEKCLWHQATTRSRHANYWWRILSQWRAKRRTVARQRSVMSPRHYWQWQQIMRTWTNDFERNDGKLFVGMKTVPCSNCFSPSTYWQRRLSTYV